jgi:DNA-binding CsgD family transcriptional regulator
MSAHSKARAVEHIAELAGRGQDLVSFWRESSEIVEETVPIYMAACWYTLDPAVIVEPAHPARISPLLMAAYGLTERERDVTRLVLQGDSTAQIAGDMVVSPHTVQHHLKSIFEKTGVRSRRDMVGKVFFSHYEPRLRENEQRALDELPLAAARSAPANQRRANRSLRLQHIRHRPKAPKTLRTRPLGRILACAS